MPAAARGGFFASATAIATIFALLPMAEILKPDGYLAALGARGYVVEAPTVP